MAKERSWNDFPQPNQTSDMEPQKRSASARYDLKGVQSAFQRCALGELPEQPLEGIRFYCTQLFSVQHCADTYCAVVKDDKRCK